MIQFYSTHQSKKTNDNFLKEERPLMKTSISAKMLVFFLFLLMGKLTSVYAQGPLTVVKDPLCNTNCCSAVIPCSCSAGVLVTGGLPPYSILVLGGSGPVGTTACVSSLCPGVYTFIVRDANNVTVQLQVNVGASCCHLNCRDTSFCFGLPDSLIVLVPPTYRDTSSGSTGGTGQGGAGTDCVFDSMWNNSPGIYPLGTTVVKWWVRQPNGSIDSCTQNVIRNPPTPYAINFTTSPPIVSGVINICNGQPITFNDLSTGTTGRLWNFGNGFYSSNANHTEPAWHYPPGTYYDTLTVFDDCGSPHDTAFTVIVDSASGPDIYCISVVCPGDTVTYHTNANCTNYTWAVTGGTFNPVPTATSDSARVIWGAGPAGTISLSVSGCTPPSTCTNATIKTVDIVPATLPVSGDTIVCAGSTSTYCIQCIPGNTHSWELLPSLAGTVTGNGTCCVTIHWNPTFFGIVTLKVNYQNVLTGQGCNLPDGSCSHDPGCGGFGLITINVKPNFGISGPLKVCPGVVSAPFNGMNLTSNTIEPNTSWKLVTPSATVIPFATTSLFNTYTWNAGPGIYLLTAYAPPGVYCTDSAMTTVEVVQVLTPNIITGPDTVCAGQPYYFSTAPNMSGVTYTWNVVGGIINPPINTSSVSITWSPGGGTVSVYQTMTAAPGCVSNSTASFVVKTWPNFPLPTITASASLACVKSSITYSIPTPLISNGTYTWSIVPATAGNIITANGLSFVTINWVNAGTPPIVKLKISRCYEDSVMLPVNLFPLPLVPSISYLPLNPCINDLVSFTTSSPGPIWNWSFGDAGTSTLTNPTHTYTSSGDFSIQLYVTNAAGCSDTAKTTIHVDTVPVLPNITGPSNVCLGTTTSYTFIEPLFPGASYDWSLSAPALGSVIGNSPNTYTIKWNTPGTDTVRLHIQATCLDTILRFVVKVNPLPTPGIGIPSPSCIGAPLTFTGTGGVNYNWSFAGGSPPSSIVNNPVVTYGSTGTFAVSLSVINANGCTASVNSTITIHPLPLAIITGPSKVCAWPATVTMAAVNQAGYSFAWTPSGITPSITQTISTPTTFSCVVTNAFGCTNTSNSITVFQAPCTGTAPPGCTLADTIDFTTAPPICLSETFTSFGPATLLGWDFGDGGTAGNTSPVSHTYAIPGIYKVIVYGISTGTNSSGGVCIDTFPVEHIITVPFDLSFTNTFACNGVGVMQVNFANTSLYVGNAASYNWTWYDVTTSTTIASTAFPAPITLSPGTHVITLSAFDPVTLGTCSVTNTIVVPIPIVANFNISTPICQGSAALFTDLSVNIANEASRLFNNGNGATGNTNPSSLIYANSPGPFTASLTVTDIYGCTSVASQNVTVLTPIAGSITVAPGTCDSVQLTASGLGPYTWQFISPPPFPTNPVWVKTSGFYKVTGTDINGCPYTAGPVQVTVLRSPTVTITGQTTYCQGEPLAIKTSAAGVSFAWVKMPGSIPVGTNSPNLGIIPVGTGSQTYQVTVTSANGCTASASYNVFIDAVPSSATIVASGPLTFCDGDSIKLSVSPTGATYLWSKSPTPALTAPANASPNLYVKVSGTYSVIVQTASGCPFPAIAPVTITVNPKPIANITGDTVLCEGEQLQLQTPPVGGGTYLWAGPVATGTNNPFIVPNMQLTDGGPYTVIVTNSFGCTQSDTITVIVNPAPVTPVITSNPAGVLCEGQLITFNATPIPAPLVVYTWSTGQIGTSITAAMQGNYFVTATNQFGCKAVSNILTIHPLPDLSCVPSGCYEFCNECATVLIPGPFGFASYTWEKLVGPTFVFYSATQNLTVLPPGGMFRLIASNSWGCSDTSDTLKITFRDCCSPIIDVVACVDTSCQDFTNGMLNNFGPYILEPNVNVITNNVAGQYAGDVYIQATDLPGASAVKADTLFHGKWCCGKFSYDFKIFNDGLTSTVNVQPQFKIWNSVLNKGFIFTSSQVINENSPWKKIAACTSIDTFPTANAGGSWAPIAPATIADWQAVASNVTDVIFVTEVAGGTGEVVGIDNACFSPQTFTVSCNLTHVGCHYTVGVNIVNNGACQNFQYQWSNGSHEPFIENAAPGTYCVKVLSCCGCIDSCCVTVPFDSSVVVVTDTVYHIGCDSIYGAIKMFVSGGVPPYTYSWNTGATTSEVYNLDAGFYNIIITDSVGCETIVHDTVRVETNCGCNSTPPPPPPTITVNSIVPDSCNSHGCIKLSFTGCCLRYGYIYHNPCNTALVDTVGPSLDSTIFCNLKAGTYTIIVKDPCGNIATETVTIPSVAPPLLAFVTYANCGSQVCVGVEGGCGPYTYLWSNGETNSCISNYIDCVDLMVTVTDANGCSFTLVVTPPHFTFDNVVNPTCCQANGSLCATVCFGQAPYFFSWSNGATTQCITGLAAGSYCLTITNANGQQATCCYTLTPGGVTPPNVHFDVLNCGALVNAYIENNGCPYTYHWQNGSTQPFFEGAHSCDSLTLTIVMCDGSEYTHGFRVPGVIPTLTPVDCHTGFGSICVATECFHCPVVSYEWAPIIAGNAINQACYSNIPSGIYTVCIQDSCGNRVCCTFYLPPGDSAQIVHVTDTVYNIGCDNPNGGIDVAVAGGYPPFTYSWSNGATTQNLTNLVAGNYTLTITDSIGCITIVHDTVVVGNDCDCSGPQAVLPTINVISINPDECNGTGCIHATFTGCCLWYSYTYINPCNSLLSYSHAQTKDSTIFCNLNAGTYILYVQDGCGNIVQQTVVVPSSAPPLTGLITYSNCGTGACVIAQGGCGPYTYDWLGGATSECIPLNNPCTSLYVTITDSRGCSTIVYLTAPGISFTNVVNPTCCQANGSLCVNACFGQGPLTYLWSNEATTQCISNLAAGTYCVTITNGVGLQVTCCYTLTEAPIHPPTVSFNYSNCGSSVMPLITNLDCESYTYHWENNSTSLVRENLTACDSITFSIVLCNGQQINYGFRVPALFPTITPVNCATGLGMVCVPINCFRCPPYTYYWSNAPAGSENGTSCLVAPPGIYNVCITNACGDVICCQVILPNVTSGIQVSATTVNPLCLGGNGTITVSATGGTPPYVGTGVYNVGAGTYTYIVTDANGCTGTVTVTLQPGAEISIHISNTPILCFGGTSQVTVSATGGTAPYQGTGVFNAQVGTHTYIVTDANGCSTSTSITVTQPAALVASASSTAIACNGGSATVTVSATGGTAPYSGTGTFTVVAGTYNYNVSDANGCSSSVTITITQPAPIVISVNATSINCYGGSSEVTISATGGVGPYEGIGTVLLTAGTHTITVVDAHGCVKTTTITITQPSKVEGMITTTQTNCTGATGTATVSPTGGVAPYTYLWNPTGQTTQTATNLAAGNYSVTITDANGCRGTVTTTVTSLGVIISSPGPITGPSSVCRNTTGIVYSISPVAGATSYVWTLPSGATGSSTTTSISVAFGSTYAGGFICVSAVGPCGTSAPSCMNVPVISTYSGVPISISGPVIVCGPTVVVYSTSAINALGYTWTLTGGATILSGQGTNTITVSIPAGFGQGSVQVYSTNCFGNSAVKGILISGIPTHGFPVTGPSYVCANSSATYSMPIVTGATSYVWTVSGNATLGTNTLSATTTTQVINFGPTWTSGTVSVAAVNACGPYVKSFIVRSTPVQPGSISGPGGNLCNTTATYSTLAVTAATSYLWTVPSGVTINGSNTGLSINVTFGSSFTSNSANICVSAVNSCGAGPARCYTVTSRPPAPIISGPASVCKSDVADQYTIAPVTGATSYSWLVTGGATITPSGTGLSAMVNYNTALSTSAVVRAQANNACGTSAPALYGVSVSMACRIANQNDQTLTQFEAFPNPTTGKLTLSFASQTKSECVVEVENLIGVKMLMENIKLEKGNNLYELDLTGFAKGMYFLNVRTYGAENRTIRIVVN